MHFQFSFWRLNRLQFILFNWTYFLLSAIHNFAIVEPYPENIYPVEFTSAKVTCVAFDSSGEKTPEKILFMRKDQFDSYTEITANGNVYFTNRTEMVAVGEGPGRYLPLKNEKTNQKL